MTRRDLDLRLDRFAASIQHDGGNQIAAGDAEIERRQRQYTIFQMQISYQILDRQLFATQDLAAGEFDVGIDAAMCCRVSCWCRKCRSNR